MVAIRVTLSLNYLVFKLCRAWCEMSRDSKLRHRHQVRDAQRDELDASSVRSFIRSSLGWYSIHMVYVGAFDCIHIF